jgi:hypothetical protein
VFGGHDRVPVEIERVTHHLAQLFVIYALMRFDADLSRRRGATPDQGFPAFPA